VTGSAGAFGREEAIVCGNLELEKASHLAHAGMGHAHRHGVDTAWARQQVMQSDMK
jgi:hypothetical protein